MTTVDKPSSRVVEPRQPKPPHDPAAKATIESATRRIAEQNPQGTDIAMPISEHLKVPSVRSAAELLLEVSDKVAAAPTLDDQLNALVDAMTDATGAERGTLFLNDPATGELYSRVAQGTVNREIRVLNSSGIAGHVYTSGQSLIVHDAYTDDRFNRSVDEKTGYTTRDILCVPVRTVTGEIIGVAQALNKRDGKFTDDDLALLEAMTRQASIALQSTLYVERMEKARQLESEFLDVVADVSTEINLGPLLQKIIDAITKMLNADRSTLFLNDEKTGELFTQIGQGLGATMIRLPNDTGIAGAVFTSGKSVNIPYAYADLRFNPSFDKQTGYFTRSILCVPVVNKDGNVIGVTQVLNKRGGPFTDEDEARLKAFTSQISIGLENAKLFNDVQQMKNYNESILQSMSNGVVTLDENHTIRTCNASALRIMHTREEDLIGKEADEVFTLDNAWILERLEKIKNNLNVDIAMDTDLVFDGERVSANVTILPLTDASGAEVLGSMLLIEDITNEKRMKSTMSRYMDPGVADRLMGGAEDILGGQSSEATVLFSDIRNFTTIAEELGAQGTVSMLNEYFTVQVEEITREGGMLDKFIGDAIMAVFGTPIPHDDDPDRAVRAAMSMMRALREFNDARKTAARPPIRIGIGINTGNIVSGNIGSPKRMDYTVIGDGVNLASRLESACKQYGVGVLASERTVGQLKGTYRMREIDHVVVKGRTKPVAIYEILDFYDNETFPNVVDVLAHFRDGLAFYRKGQWDKAIGEFQAGLDLNGEDEISRIYLDRCKTLKKRPPKDWDGIWVMDRK